MPNSKQVKNAKQKQKVRARKDNNSISERAIAYEERHTYAEQFSSKSLCTEANQTLLLGTDSSTMVLRCTVCTSHCQNLIYHT